MKHYKIIALFRVEHFNMKPAFLTNTKLYFEISVPQNRIFYTEYSIKISIKKVVPCKNTQQ